MEEDHLDFFKDLADIRGSFRRFAGLLPQDGTLVISGDIDRYQELTEGLSCNVVTYGHSRDCNYYADGITHDSRGNASFMLHSPHTRPQRVTLQIPGDHNVYNAVAAIATADVLGIGREDTLEALTDFHGTDRRFEYKGTVEGVTIIDDYAHHPTEITATLQAAQNYPHQKLWCVFQPHTYSRTKIFMTEFARALTLADHVVLTDIYAAREKDTLGISSEDLQAAVRELGGQCDYFSSFEEAENFLQKNCINGDLLITMGAGDVHKIGESLLKK